MGEFQISNLPMILIAIAIICMGVLGYFEIKKLYLKLSEIDTKLEEINESFKKKDINNQSFSTGQQMQIPPHILEQRRMMILRQQQQQQQQQNQGIHNLQQSKTDKEELNLESNKDIIESENSYDDELEASSESSNTTSDEEDIEDIISKDNDEIVSKDDDDNISHTTEMTIELDNEFKHLSVKELKELCQENNLQVSGNKSKLISRLLENKNLDN